MAYQQEYFSEYNLILIRVFGSVSLEENREIGLALQKTLDQVETTADVVFDLREIEGFPTSMSQLRETSAVIRNPKLGWVILLTGKKPLLKLVATTLIHLQTRTGRIRVFDTLESTFTFLQGMQSAASPRAIWLSKLYQTLK